MKINDFKPTQNPNIIQFLALVAQLRNPEGGCPWDLAQTFESMMPHLLEETYEVAEAIHTKDRISLREELGDLLLQIVFLSQLAKEEGAFDFNGVLADIHNKLIYRHPHVFGNKKAKNSQEALENWEAQKAQDEKHQAHESILDDLPFALPALTRANKLQKRCAKVGFDWDNPRSVFKKVEEELQEVQDEMDNSPIQIVKLEEELGDLLFASVNLCRHYNIDAENCLRKANAKFERRFRGVEQLVKSEEKSISDYSLQELDNFWNKIKSSE